jgi:hypothetical protein
MGKGLSKNADMADGGGRNLFDVLGVTTIQAVMEELRRRCNNNGEIDIYDIAYFARLVR